MNKSLENLGIGVYGPDALSWRSKAMIYPDVVTDKDRVWSGIDWFTAEFGHPLDFSGEDLIGKYGYSSGAKYSIENGQLAVKTGAEGFTFGFGGVPNDKDRPAVRLGADWGANRKDRVRIQIVLEQDADESQWSFSQANAWDYRELGSFKVSGRGKQTVEADVALTRELIFDFNTTTGFKIQCKTPDTGLRIDSIKLAPSSANLYFRKSFKLAEKPSAAHASFNYYSVFDLYVNDQLVISGNGMYPNGPTRDVDLTAYLKAGTNTIAYRRQFYSWEDSMWEAFLFEGAAVSQKGTLTRILSGPDWKCSFQAPEGWMHPGFDDSHWKNAREIDEHTQNNGAIIPYLTNLNDGTPVPNGNVPHHMGLLDAAPDGRQYPLFDFTKAPAFRLRVPSGLQGKFKLSAEVYKAGTDTLVERVAMPRFTTQGAFAVATAKMATRAVGPYRVLWKLTDLQGKNLDTRRDEMIVVGPIPQEKLPLASFEQNLEKRLERVVHIDCTKVPAAGTFVDQNGPWSQSEANKGLVTTADGMTYRETGSYVYDHFSYLLPSLELGKPYMVEIMVPDNQDRAVYSSVSTAHPIAYFNNGPVHGKYVATGSARTGALYPLTYKFRKLRYLYYPSASTNAVTVQNGLSGHRGAASEINVYAIKGGLPALAVPASPRLMGSHEERMTVAAGMFGAENPLENSLQFVASGHYDAWYHWYRILERKIEFLRFQGRNMSVEGVYMYGDTNFPKKRATWSSNEDFDLPYLAIKMYQYNGIKPYLGVEYVADTSIGIDKVDTVSDRRMQAGAPTIQTVDRFGRQVGRGVYGNGNFLHPTTKKYFHGVLQEIYNRYHDAGPVAGLHVVSGGWWMPGFTVGTNDSMRITEVGYDDYTMGLFEKETGIKLGIDAKDPKRFGKRYDLLMGPHHDKWMAWRAQKTRDSIGEIAGLLQTQPQKWNLLIEPSPYQSGYPNPLFNNPFKDAKSTPQERAKGFATFMADTDMPLDLYQNLPPNIAIAPQIQATGWLRRDVNENILNTHGMISDPNTSRGITSLKAVAVGGSLDEANIPVDKIDKWIYAYSGPGMYIPRGIEDNAMGDFVIVVTHGIPDTIIYSWVDVEMESAFGPQNRRFNKSFYVTPTGTNFTGVPAKGIIAQTAPKVGGGVYVRLINNTPYPVSGIIATTATEAKDLVYDAVLKPGPTSGAMRKFALSLPPNDIRIITLNQAQTPKLNLNFDYDAFTRAQIAKQANVILGDASVAEALPPAKRAALVAAVASSDAVATQRLLMDWEVLAVTTKLK